MPLITGIIPVEQDHVRHLGLAPVQRLAPVASFLDLEIQRFEDNAVRPCE
jgi:hypothetical protein